MRKLTKRQLKLCDTIVEAVSLCAEERRDTIDFGGHLLEVAKCLRDALKHWDRFEDGEEGEGDE